MVVYTQQENVSSRSANEEFNLVKRRIRPRSRASIPLFRASNLGIFVRRRPLPLFSKRSILRSDGESLSSNDDTFMPQLLDNNEQLQQRFDDYSYNPGPMFG